MSDPVGVTRGIYNFLGIPWPSDGDERVMAHFALDSLSKSSKRSYYSTYRNGSAFDPHHWRQELDVAEISLIESECGAVMDSLGYERTVVTGSLPFGEFEKRSMG